MTERSTINSVTFLKPACLAGVGELPAGTYSVETVDEQIAGLSFVAYRRLSTIIVAERSFGGGGAVVRQALDIDPKDLDEALRRDAASV